MAYTTIKKSSDYFNTKLYTGNFSTNAITGVGFAPDFVWIKERSSTSSHVLGTTVQGVNKRLQSDTTSAEGTLSNIFTSFDSDGFTNGADNGVNQNGETYASWNWKANGSGSSNTAGSINSTVSANTTSGFSIVKYTGNGTAGATIGHGLGTAPHCIIMKELSNANDWFVYHQATGATKRLKLNQAVTSATSTFLNNTTPTSSVYAVDGGAAGNTNSTNYIAYCFAEKQGYSKFGSYVGNGSTNGPFVYTGFKPAFVITKRIDAGGGGWGINDNKRPNYNPENLYLVANTNSAEASDGSWTMDLLSNGWKARYNNGHFNAAGGSYIYMAFAEQPLVGDNPATAR
jgi:hypothetical protein